MQEKRKIVMWDWDGTLVDTMGDHANLAGSLISRHFGVSPDFGKKKYLETTGKPFDVQLEMIFPDANTSIREACARDYHTKKMDYVYGNPKDFPHSVETIETLVDVFPDIVQFISSSTEEGLINKWANGRGVCDYFSGILGRESGSKEEHIAFVRASYPDAEIYFISDSPGDMYFQAICIGVDVSQSKVRSFIKSPAECFSQNPIESGWLIGVLKNK
jgi:beta-phosphoglucomutase-like phosphatase (HAD superfamily)